MRQNKGLQCRSIQVVQLKFDLDFEAPTSDQMFDSIGMANTLNKISVWALIGLTLKCYYFIFTLKNVANRDCITEKRQYLKAK